MGPFNILLSSGGTLVALLGGYPLAHRAGAQFTHWLIEEALHRPPITSFDDWVDDLAMLRHDEAVFLCGRDLREQAPEAALATS